MTNPHDVTSPTEEEMELDRLREENRRLREALMVARPELQSLAEWEGECDHEVNHCRCPTERALEVIDAALSQTKGGAE